MGSHAIPSAGPTSSGAHAGSQSDFRVSSKADIRRVQEWMGHADIQTTMRFLHYAPHEQDAQLVVEACRLDDFEERGTRKSSRAPSARGARLRRQTNEP